MKFCKNCEFYRNGLLTGSAMCHNQVAIIGYDPVDGFPDRYQCKIMRQEGRHCGPEAKLFVEKVVTDNLWTQIFGQRQT